MSFRFFSDGCHVYIRVTRNSRSINFALFQTPIAQELSAIMNRNSQKKYPVILDMEICEVLVTALVRENPANLPQIVRAGLRGVEKPSKPSKLTRVWRRV